MPANQSAGNELFAALYNATKNSLYHYLCTYTKDVHLVEDLMQQCYLKIWERFDQLQDYNKALPLVKTIAHHLLIDVVRKRMKEDTVWLETLEGEIENLMEAPADTSFVFLQALDKAIDRLPENCRKVYLMHREEGLSYREIAAQLSVSVSMIEKHMSKSIKLLKADLLKDYALVLAIAISMSVN
ncbi:RNA polymerase sigma factor [Deminuibacter soli]|uniref:RNA polymerase sigma-70 factor n=1 Tax=Deminuibacter soli TaxID=2291815 RepID=A0A3E1NFX3_9BACT|nr:sigma-70 family RNA polymerase sigma factor [Deminuibacter soli]RFM26860.1 hypothetical protein DXN05_17895 [Deminuibacter soli]